VLDEPETSEGTRVATGDRSGDPAAE
jgi:hypothetical protein